MEEWDIFDKYRDFMGYTKPRKNGLSNDEFHIVVRIWIVNSKGEILLSQRNANKRGGLLWECTGGSVLSGESPREAAIREVYEELGIELNAEDATLIMSERRDMSHDFYDIWLIRKDVDIDQIKLELEEVIAVKWVSIYEFDHMYRKKEIMPTLSFFSDLYKIIFA